MAASRFAYHFFDSPSQSARLYRIGLAAVTRGVEVGRPRAPRRAPRPARRGMSLDEPARVEVGVEILKRGGKRR